jgi:hypothetical protein
LFDVELVISNDEVAIEPSVEEIEHVFLKCVERMVSAIRSVTSVDNDAMSLLTLENRVLLNIGAGDPLFHDIDTETKEVKTYITKRIELAMTRPTALSNMYNDFTWLLESETEEYIESFMNKNEGHPTFTIYQEELIRLDTAMRTISELSFQEENFELVRVRTKNVRDILYNKAKKMRDRLADEIAMEAKAENKAVIEQYKNILRRIKEKPVNEKQLKELREFITKSRETVEKLKDVVSNIRANIALVESFYIPLAIEEGEIWEALTFPSIVEASGREVEIDLEADKIRMMDKLQRDKEKFEIDIELIGKRVAHSKLLENYNDREKIVEEFNRLTEEISEAQNKAKEFNSREGMMYI